MRKTGMTVIDNNGDIAIFPSHVKSSESIPAGHYKHHFDGDTGRNYIERIDTPSPANHKVYGDYTNRIERIITRLNHNPNKNTGVLLSGHKGTGKSIFLQQLAVKGLSLDLPIIHITMCTPGLAHYISTIKQQCIIIMDEFEKTFPTKEQQNTLLTILDGSTHSTNHLYVLAINDLDKMSDFFIDRPGRVHYHFKSSFLTIEQIREYLQDNLNEKAKERFDEVVGYTLCINCTYDILNAVVYEVNAGTSIEEIKNSLNVSAVSEFYPTVKYTDGTEVQMYVSLDLNNDYNSLNVRRVFKGNTHPYMDDIDNRIKEGCKFDIDYKYKEYKNITESERPYYATSYTEIPNEAIMVDEKGNFSVNMDIMRKYNLEDRNGNIDSQQYYSAFGIEAITLTPKKDNKFNRSFF